MCNALPAGRAEARNRAYEFCRASATSPPEMVMFYKIASIDVHKRVLIVVIAAISDDVKDVQGEALEFESRRFGASASERLHLIAWLQQHGVMAVVMESTAQYWKPVWYD